MQNLNVVKKEADKYVKMIADIGGGDVELMDVDSVRISGAGGFSGQIGEKFPNVPKSYQAAKDFKDQIVIEDAENDHLVTECVVFKNYNLKSLIATPIIVDGEVLAILGITVKKNASPVLIADFQLYTIVARQTADFISAAYKNLKDAEEYMSMFSAFEIVVRNMDEGAIVVNDKDEIQIINKSAKAQLGIGKIIDHDKIILSRTGDKISGSEEFKIKIDNVESTVFGKVFNVEDSPKYSYIILFRDIKTLKSSIYDAMNTVNVAELDSIIGSSKATKRLKDEIIKVAKSFSTVLITGESGTGKEMVATAIWKNSDRKDEKFVAINCAAIPEALLESELFGYVKGAFTNADPKGRMGKFELANKGVIFLDEIGDMPLHLQSKLLRVIQEKRISRIGSNQVIPLDVRIIAATNQNLTEMIRQNTFRDDLYYRLNVIPIEIPALRDRPADIKDLFFYFISYYSQVFGKNFIRVEDDVLDLLLKYPWPGNIRELENACEYMVNMMEFGVVEKKTLPKSIFEPLSVNLKKENTKLIRRLEEIEREEILKALEMFGNDTKGKHEAADALGIGIATLYRKMQKLS